MLELAALVQTETVALAIATFAAIAVSIPQVIERRGSGWKAIAEERQAVLSERDVELGRLRIENEGLKLRPDLTALQEQIAGAMELAGERYEAHEERAAQRAENLLGAMDAQRLALNAITDELKSLHLRESA